MEPYGFQGQKHPRLNSKILQSHGWSKVELKLLLEIKLNLKDHSNEWSSTIMRHPEFISGS